MKKNKKGFTLAELLIVVAIIGVLVAISIPIFSKLVEKARFATNVANARAAYAAVEAEFLTTNHPSEGETYYSYDTETGKAVSGVNNIDGDYEGVGLIKDGKESMPLSSWTTSTYIGSHSDWPLGKHVYKKWALVVVNTTGKVRQYKVYTQ